MFTSCNVSQDRPKRPRPILFIQYNLHAVPVNNV